MHRDFWAGFLSGLTNVCSVKSSVGNEAASHKNKDIISTYFRQIENDILKAFKKYNEK